MGFNAIHCSFLWFRDHFEYAPRQWETTLHCNVVDDWLGAYTKWTLVVWFIKSNTIPVQHWRSLFQWVIINHFSFNQGTTSVQETCIGLLYCVGHNSWWHMTCAQQAACNPKLEMISLRHPWCWHLQNLNITKESKGSPWQLKWNSLISLRSFWKISWGWFNTKMAYYQYRKLALHSKAV